MPDRTVVIFNRFSHKPLDVRGGATAPGTIIQQFQYHGGANQRWTVRDAGQCPVAGGAVACMFASLSSAGQAMTMDSSDPANVKVLQQPLAPTNVFAEDYGQLWALEELHRSSSRDTRRYVIRNAKDGNVLGLKSESNADGIEVAVGPYQDKESQRWEILYQLNLQTVDANDIVVIFSKHSHKCLDVPGSTSNDVDIQQYTYNGGRNQFWSVGTTAFPTVMMPAHAVRALDLKDPSSSDPSVPAGARLQVVQRAPSGENRQKWGIHRRPDGDFMIDNAIDPYSVFVGQRGTVFLGAVLDVVNGTKNDGDSIQLYTPHGGPNQIWEIWVSEPFS